MVDTDYRVFAQLRLSSVAQVDKGLRRDAWLSAFNSISRKHVDFVVCRSDDLAIIVAIELDDESHEKGKRRDRDIVVDKILEAAGIPLMRVKAATSYAPNEIKNIFANEMNWGIAGEVAAQNQEAITLEDNADRNGDEAFATWNTSLCTRWPIYWSRPIMTVSKR